MPRLTLRYKLLTAFAIVLLPMLALIVYDYYDGYRRQSEATIEQQIRTGQAVGMLVEASVDDALAIAWTFSSNPVVRTLDSLQIDPYLASLQSSLPEYDNIAVLDLQGTAVGLMAPQVQPDEPRPTGAGRAYFQAVTSTLQPAVSEVLISRATGNPTMAVAVPMLDESGTLAGVVVAALDLDYLARRVKTIDTPPSQAIFLTDQQGMLAFHSLLSDEQWGRRNLSDYAPVRSALDGGSFREQSLLSINGDVRMVATVATPKYAWVVGVSIPTSDVLGPMQAALVARLQLFLAVLAFACVLAVVVARQLVLRPLETLAAHLQAFGKDRLDRRVELRTGDEVELVARSFNAMADRLQRADEAKDAALAEAKRRADELDAIIQTMAEGVTIITNGGQSVRMNRAAREILGLPADEGVPISLRHFKEADVRHRDCRPMRQEDWPITRALRGETFVEQELDYRRPDGKWINLLFAGSSLWDERGRVVLGVNVFRDITAMRELERQREEFISVVAHDLRNALTVVAGYSNILQRLPAEQHNSPREQRAIQSVHGGVRRIERMVLDLLDVSRIEARRLALSKKPIDLSATVHEIVQRAGELTKGHAVRLQERNDIVLVEADPDRIEQILSNLLSNAGKYSYPDTDIAVAVEPHGDDAHVSVTNRGVGIPMAEISNLFTRWHRARSVGRQQAAGLGLGLYIAKGLVEAHGGRIWVESEPHKETTFHFTLPLASGMSATG